MAEPALIGIDVGTSSTKAVIMERSGHVIAGAAREYPVDSPQSSWAEQRPETWVGATLESVAEALDRSAVSPHAVAGISFSGQMHGLVCLGDQGHPVRPAIIWADQRSRNEVAGVASRLGNDRLAAWTGNPVATGFQLPSWLWIQRHEPEVAARTRWLLLPKDYVRYRLTGEIGAEPSDASSTSLFDPRELAWSRPLIDCLELDARVLPPVGKSSGIAGYLVPRAARAMGLLPGIPVIYGGSDQAVQALGNGVVAEGVLSSTIGTGGQLLLPTSRAVVDEKLRMHCFCHVLPGLWHNETAILSAGLSLRWLRDMVARHGDYGALADMASTVPPGADGLVFLPYLSGERTPHMDPRARGCFVGLTRRHGVPHMVRSVMEGVVLAMRQGLELMTSLGGSVDAVVASGGAARHPLWVKLQADIYGRPVTTTCVSESAAVGAAMLAGIGTGLYVDGADAVRHVVRWNPVTTDPDASDAEAYERLYGIYVDLYPALKPTMHGLGRIAGQS